MKKKMKWCEISHSTFLRIIYEAYGREPFDWVEYRLYDGDGSVDRTVEVARYKRMKILLILFGGVHILMAMAMAMLIRA